MLIKDGGTLVLGGLIQDNVSNSENSVPLLGNIPLIGELFRTRNTEQDQEQLPDLPAAAHPARRRAGGHRDRRQVQLHARRAAPPQQGSGRQAAAAAVAPARSCCRRSHNGATQGGVLAARRCSARPATRTSAPIRCGHAAGSAGHDAAAAGSGQQRRRRAAGDAQHAVPPARPATPTAPTAAAGGARSRERPAEQSRSARRPTRAAVHLRRRHGVLVRGVEDGRRRLRLSRTGLAAWRWPKCAATCACR